MLLLAAGLGAAAAFARRVPSRPAHARPRQPSVAVSLAALPPRPRAAPPAPPPPGALPGALPGARGGCPEGTVAVAGTYCTDARQRCLEWAEGGRSRCLRFEAPSRCAGRREALSFCIDRYEWPNRAGARPDVMVTWYQAEALCRAAGRRLCTEREWTFACEGEAMLPYGYGYDRAPGACTVDHFARMPDRALLHDRRRAAAEVARVYEAAPSGSAPRCVSPFGAFDMVGNVDEWTVNERGRPFRSSLKGGWWGRIRGRCRPATRAHGETFSYYQIGFRCCADRAAPPAAPAPEGARRAHRRRHRRHRERRHD